MANANALQISYRKKSCLNKRYYFININIIMKRSDYVANVLSLSSKMKYGDLGQNTEVNTKNPRVNKIK